MSIDVAITHETRYRYDRLVTMLPHVIRLRPAAHTRTPILNYTLHVSPDAHFINWQQDPFANWQARLVFPEKVDHLTVKVELAARMDAINPFDFFVDDYAQDADFVYDETHQEELLPYRGREPVDGILKDFIASAPRCSGPTNDFLVSLNQYVEREIAYIVRMEPGVQTPTETLERKMGSCRDSSWLLVQMLRQFGYAARFVSGYLIQLVPDEKPVEGPQGTAKDFTDLHAWCEVYLPGAGWVGLDPTSGLFAGEGHIPLAATPSPRSAAPISGALDPCEVTFDVQMELRRINEQPRPSWPLNETQWGQVRATAQEVDRRLVQSDVRLTVGGEPTFVSATDRDADEWTTEAVGPTKRQFADRLARRLRDRFAPGGGIHHGQGKWYPGEQLPRWSFEIHWRNDGEALWTRPELIAEETVQAPADISKAEVFITALARQLGVDADHVTPVFEDPVYFTHAEQKLPVDVDPVENNLSDPENRRKLAEVFEQGLDKPVAFILPIQPAQSADKGNALRWASEKWRTRRARLFLVPGGSPAGLRLPLESLEAVAEGDRPLPYPADPFNALRRLPQRQAAHAIQSQGQPSHHTGAASVEMSPTLAVRTALAVELRQGVVHVFLPPLQTADGYVALTQAIEHVADSHHIELRVEGYPPPTDARMNVVKVTPDPGVIEVNVQPAHSWEEQNAIMTGLYDDARAVGLDASSYLIDGRPTGSGGGNHIVMGGATPADSPFLRRPDLLASVLRFWQNHPSLSYIFSGLFVGPTSQAPRIDEARHDSLYELELALERLPSAPEAPPWLVDRLFRHLLIDVTGNTHRTEICIDKLYSPDGPAGRLGLVEFRAFEMPPHPRMAGVLSLLMRGLIAWFWKTPYQAPLKRWGTALHDRFMLPHYLECDLRDVLSALSEGLGLTFDSRWFEAALAFRFPEAGTVTVGHTTLKLTHGIEPWPALGEDGTIGGTTRFVDSSLERMQIMVADLPEHLRVTCNGCVLPLQAIDDQQQVCGVRYRAWLPPHCLHPTIKAHTPLRFDLVDPQAGRSLGGCTYHATHPGGRAHDDRPINALEAEGRRLARFSTHHTPGPMVLRHPPVSDEFPVTLDLRRII